jgi:hypothetical protein
MDREKPGEYQKLHHATFEPKPGLDDMGISKTQSYRWQLEAGGLYITNWQKHQNIERMDKIKQEWRLASQNYRDRQKLLKSGETLNITTKSDSSHITSYDSHNIEQNRTEQNVLLLNTGEVIENVFLLYETNIAGELKLYAEARLGELIKSEQEAGRLSTGGNPHKDFNGYNDVTVKTLSDYNLTKQDSFHAHCTRHSKNNS